MTRATITDVAARAGVTKSTVSHALSGKRPVAPATRLRIEQAVADLGYHPNAIAQRLAAGRSRTIGFVYPLYAPQIAGYEMRFIAAAANAVNQAGYAFVLLTQPDRTGGTLDPFFYSGLLDGVILFQVRRHDPRIEALRDAGLPFVLIGQTADNTGLAYVDIDIIAAMTWCVSHLAELGHRHIACLHQDDPEFGFGARVLAGYRMACADHGLSPVVRPCALSTEGGQQATLALLTEHSEITGVIAWNDLAAWGVNQAAIATGRRVPADLSVICFDQSNISSLVPFHPTVVDVRPEEMSRRAAEMLLAILSGESDGERVLLSPGFVVGETSALAPAAVGRDAHTNPSVGQSA
jgi:DNA-binding LacI/PurR family transcriptional regulator